MTRRALDLSPSRVQVRPTEQEKSSTGRSWRGERLRWGRIRHLGLHNEYHAYFSLIVAFLPFLRLARSITPLQELLPKSLRLLWWMQTFQVRPLVHFRPRAFVRWRIPGVSWQAYPPFLCSFWMEDQPCDGGDVRTWTLHRWRLLRETAALLRRDQRCVATLHSSHCLSSSFL